MYTLITGGSGFIGQNYILHLQKLKTKKCYKYRLFKLCWKISKSPKTFRR